MMMMMRLFLQFTLWFNGFVGAHVISGNVFEPRALDELLPQWRQDGVDFRYLQHFVPCAN